MGTSWRRKKTLSLDHVFRHYHAGFQASLRFPMQSVLATPGTILLQFQSRLIVAPVLLGGVITLLALGASQCNYNTNCSLGHDKSLC
jgi:hypothetical protein